ncbi:MAG: hypothetical protein IJV80_05780, partial [Clostridia bacterium]|nr:hypothetical protein [Clostridia bacterium]
QTTLTQKPVIYRLSKIAIECGVWMISIPYQEELASLQEDMHGNCLEEFYGVEDCAVYKKLVQNGIVRIVSSAPRKL